MAQRRNGFQRHVAGSLHRPFVILFQQDSAHQPDDGGVVGEDTDSAAVSNWTVRVHAAEADRHLADLRLCEPCISIWD